MTEHVFRVRPYQAAFHKALVNRTHDRLLAIWHRRAGKDEIVLNAMRTAALSSPGTYWHCFPEQAQARKAIWNGVNGKTGKRRIFEAFPAQVIKRMQDDDMFIELRNGGTFQLIGSDRYDSTVGSGPKGVGYSEWALSNPAAWAYHQPMIRESKGFAAFITTPRGNNHAKTMLDNAKGNPAWFSEVLTAEDTGALSVEELADALAEYQGLWGMDLGRALFEQEYLCSFAGAMVGAYYGAEMAKAERDGRVCVVDVDPAYPVHTAWDLGKAVNNPIWCFQVIGSQLRIVDFYQPESLNVEDWCFELNRRGYNGNDYVPHDIITTEWGSSRTRIEVLTALGRKPKRIPMVSVADGQQAGRVAINSMVMDKGRCGDVGAEGLKAYRREWDQDMKRFRDTPVKDWSEHIGSAWRYLGLSWKEARVEKPPVVKKDQPVYTARADGTAYSNMTVREQIDAMVKRKRGRG
jgi:phage terminase large subunit